jgi:hypothetical protein
VAPAFRFCLSNLTLAQAIPVRYLIPLFSHIIVTPTCWYCAQRYLWLKDDIVALTGVETVEKASLNK